MGLDWSGHSNAEEHQKTDYDVVADSDETVDDIPHKKSQVYNLVGSDGCLYGSEQSNEEKYQTTEFAV